MSARPMDPDAWCAAVQRAADRIGLAREAVDAELAVAAIDAARHGPPALPVIPPARLPEYADVWRESAGLRALIREAGRRPAAEVAASRVVRGLWEMAHSDHWLEPVG